MIYRTIGVKRLIGLDEAFRGQTLAFWFPVTIRMSFGTFYLYSKLILDRLHCLTAKDICIMPATFDLRI